jgi:hypothetical protein
MGENGCCVAEVGGKYRKLFISLFTDELKS